MDIGGKNVLSRGEQKSKGKMGAYILSPKLQERRPEVRFLGMEVKTLDFHLNVRGFIRWF